MRCVLYLEDEKRKNCKLEEKSSSKKFNMSNQNRETMHKEVDEMAVKAEKTGLYIAD